MKEGQIYPTETLTIQPFVVPFLMLVGLLLLMAVLVAWVQRRFFSKDDSSADPNAMLSEFREAEEEGELTPEEYRKIKAKLAARIRDSAKKSKPA